MSDYQLSDAMGARHLAARWVLVGTLTLETAIHVGGDGHSAVDMPLLRDVREGRLLLPGTTLAGALRSALTDRLLGYWEDEGAAQVVGELFGGGRRDRNGSQSLLITFDALGTLPSNSSTEIRDGVSISPIFGVAEEHKKFDFEVAPRGTEFLARLDLLVPQSSNTASMEKRLVEALASAVDALSLDGNGLGARRSRGLGRLRSTWRAWRYDLTTAEGWAAWALSLHELSLTPEMPPQTVLEAVELAAPEAVKPLGLAPDRRARIFVDLELRLLHDILVRSPGIESGAPDVTHLRSGGEPVLPGSSLAGVMRTQGFRIARLVRESRGDAESWIERLFGPRFEGQHPPPGFHPHASRLRVGESVLTQSHAQRQTRVAINRFTQGVVDTALFDEESQSGGSATVRLELRTPHNGELGLVLLVLKDLLDGVVPIGGTSSVGRGWVRGSAQITCGTPDGVHGSVKIQPGSPPVGEAAAHIDAAIRAFWEAETIESTRSQMGGGQP